MSKNYTDCYIAFLDILGFKELIKTKSCDELYSIFTEKMKKHTSKIYKGAKEIINLNDVKLKVMSDSICFFVDSKIQNSLFGLILTCAEFQAELLKYSKPILSRGAIVKGKLYANGDIIFGPGFVDAYIMEEQKATYPRIIMTINTFDSAKCNTDDCIANYLSNLVYRDTDDFITIDSLEVFEGFDTDGTYCKNLYNHILNALNTTEDNSVREKYLYLKNRLLRWYKPNDKDH